MKLTVLVDNNTYIDEYYYGEPGVCYYIEDGGRRLLFDLGYSDVFLKNANKMGIDLRQVDTVAFSHGHNDHMGGFRTLIEYLYSGKTGEYGPEVSARRDEKKDGRIRVVAHPDCFMQKRYEGLSIGTDISLKEAERFFELNLSKEPVQISENIWFLGEIPQIHDFEQRTAIGEKKRADDASGSTREKGRRSVDESMRKKGGRNAAESMRQMNGGSAAEPIRETGDEGNRQSEREIWTADFCMEDSALVYKDTERLFIITGCSHSGICNIVSYAEQLFEGCSVTGILGGFHLFDMDERAEKTAAFLQEKKLDGLFPCHCVSLAVKCEMSRVMPIREVGVGMRLEL